MPGPAARLFSLSLSLLAALGDALSPPACAACDALAPERSGFCATCTATVTLDATPWHLGAEGQLCASLDGARADRAVAFGTFGGALAVALRRLKYEGRPDLARPLGRLTGRAARAAHLEGDVVVPVPLHPRRLAERGYNQAALLAAEVASELGARLAARALARARNTAQQARLDREGRLRNVTEAFATRARRAVQGRRVILVDDVATTGATLEACRATLLAAGASSVSAVVVARAG